MPTDPFASAASLEGVPSAFAAARDGLDALLRDRGQRRTRPEQTTESLLRGAVASARLDGSHSDLEDVRSGEADPIAAASVRTYSQLLALLPTWRASPLQALARLHTFAAAGLVPDADLGRPVNPGGATRLRDLGRMLGEQTRAPGLVVAALVHAEIVAADSFACADGVVARAAERLVLVSTGVDPASLTIPELGHLELEGAYRQGLISYASGGPTGVHRWLLYAAEAYAAGGSAAQGLG